MLEGRLPPHSIDAEEGVNGSILVDGLCIKQVQYLKPDDFFSNYNRLIFEACLNLYRRNQALDQITVAEELERTNKLKDAGGAAYLSHLIANIPTSLDVESYASIVHRHSVSRNLITAASQIAAIGYEVESDIDGAVQKANDILEQVKHGANVNKMEIITPEQMAQAMLDMLNHGQPHLQWGFADLDEVAIGIYPQDYIILGARPSVGKTQLMLEVADSLGRTGKKVLFVSTEMPMNPVIERYIARTLHISVRDFRLRRLQDNILDDVLEKKFMEASGVLSQLPVYYLFGKRTSDSIWENARKMQERYGLDAIFVDYLQLLLDCNRGRENHSVAVGVVSHNLKAMGQELNVPVIVASQLNRLVEYRNDKRPMLADLRESGDIEQDADVVFLLHRPELYPDDYGNVADEDRGVLEMIMAKNRQLGMADYPVRLQWRPDAFCYGSKVRTVGE